jgi:hypothetical protein
MRARVGARIHPRNPTTHSLDFPRPAALLITGRKPPQRSFSTSHWCAFGVARHPTRWGAARPQRGRDDQGRSGCCQVGQAVPNCVPTEHNLLKLATSLISVLQIGIASQCGEKRTPVHQPQHSALYVLPIFCSICFRPEDPSLSDGG